MIDANFIYAGRAVFTVQNDKNTHYTFKIQRASLKGVEQDKQPWFAYILGKNAQFAYIGRIVDDKWKATTKSTFLPTSTPVRVLDFALRIINKKQQLPSGYSIQHEGKCGKCSRPLTDPTSLIYGLGPSCRQHIL